MSPKIPQTEWGAIVARREQGESLNAIARSYDCSAATIHSILNRARQGDNAPAAASEPAEASEPVAAPEEIAPPVPTPPPIAVSELPNFLTRSTRPAAPPAPRPPVSRDGASSSGPASSGPISAGPISSGPVANGPVRPPSEPRSPDQRPFDRQSRRVEIVPPRNGANVRRADAGDHAEEPAALPRPTNPLPHALATLPEALTATLDSGLRAHAETVVEAFRAAFDRALAEDSPEARQALRLAAAELMRAGARTTIVLERLEASSHRPSFPRRDRPNGTAPQRPAG
jgi:hypothetical protein